MAKAIELSETANVDLTERDEQRMRRQATMNLVTVTPLGDRAASYMADALKLAQADNEKMHAYVRLYARTAFRLARRSLGEVD